MIIDKAVTDIFHSTIQVGSQTIIGATRPGSDYDVLCYTRCNWLAIHRLKKLGYFVTSTKAPALSPYHFNFNTFTSMRHDNNVNLIITSSKKFYNRFRDANRVAQELLLTTKSDRIILFQYILYGRHYDK